MAGGPEITFSAWPDMLGYVGGGILAICMIPQVGNDCSTSHVLFF